MISIEERHRADVRTVARFDASPTFDTPAATGSWSSVCDIDQLEPLWGEAALLGRVQLALFLLPDRTLYAVTNRDPATGSFVMSRGIVGSRGDRCTVASPLHKQVYDLETGRCFTSPDYCLQTFPVRVEGGVVQVLLADARAGASAA